MQTGCSNFVSRKGIWDNVHLAINKLAISNVCTRLLPQMRPVVLKVVLTSMDFVLIYCCKFISFMFLLGWAKSPPHIY